MRRFLVPGGYSSKHLGPLEDLHQMIHSDILDVGSLFDQAAVRQDYCASLPDLPDYERRSPRESCDCLHICHDRSNREDHILVVRREGSADKPDELEDGLFIDRDRYGDVLAVEIYHSPVPKAKQILKRLAARFDCPDLALAAQWLTKDQGYILFPSGRVVPPPAPYPFEDPYRSGASIEGLEAFLKGDLHPILRPDRPSVR